MYNVQWRRKRRWRSRHGSLCTQQTLHSMHLACAFAKTFAMKTSNDVISRPPPTPPSRDLTMLTTPMCGEHGRITGLRHGRMRRKSLLLCTKLPWMGGTDTERRLDGRNGYGEMGGTNTGRRGNLGQRQLFELQSAAALMRRNLGVTMQLLLYLSY